MTAHEGDDARLAAEARARPFIDRQLSEAGWRIRLSGLRRAVLAAAFSGQLAGRHTDLKVIEELAEAGA